MSYKFNPFERAVGIFLTVTIVGSVVVGVGIAIKKNWFEDRIEFSTYVPTASNIRVGSSVLLAGIKVGKIDSVDIDENQKIVVHFHVLKKYGPSVTENSSISFNRPFVIGDKTLTVTSLPGKALLNGSVIPLKETWDVLDLLSGQKAEGMMTKVDSILTNLDQTLALVGNKKHVQKTLDDLSFASGELRKLLPMISRKAPHVADNMDKTLANLLILTSDLVELRPVLQDVAKKYPEGSEKTMALLNETLTVMQAVQKSFFLRSEVKEVLNQREPSSAK